LNIELFIVKLRCSKRFGKVVDRFIVDNFNELNV